MIVALLLALVGATGVPAPAAAASRVPKVAIIVGPAGAITSSYRALADEAAAAARRTSADVVTVYSPNATWPAVKRAVNGASIVVYLGHGNGWPSPYRNALYPPSQNGFGLNPVAGGGDSDHQYFGEDAIGRLQLAPNAVVILSHLCYASGNSEPGLAEGTLVQAVQRVDNYGAGFLRAGAAAVVAEAYLGPAYYVRALLGGGGRIEDIWSKAPTANGRHSVAQPSVRTPGYTLHLDPERAGSGFVRSLVSRGLTAAELRAGAMGTVGGSSSAGGVIGPPPEPSLASAGLRFGDPALGSLPIAGTKTRLTLPLAAGRPTRVPAGAEVSVRWDPLLLDPPLASPAPSPSPTASPAPSVLPRPTLAPSASPRTSSSPTPAATDASVSPSPAPAVTSPTPAASPTPTPIATPTATPAPDVPEVDLIVPEQLGSVVEPVRTTRAGNGISLKVTIPSAPGLYRLVATLHTPGGVAYDAATQALLTPMLVRVGGRMTAAYGLPSTMAMAAGSSAEVAVGVLNAGAVRWDQEVTAPPDRIPGGPETINRTATLPAQLVATWVSTGGLPVPPPVSISLDDAVSVPGGTAPAIVSLSAPAAAGHYLLLLDVVTPAAGPLSALGSAPGIIRVSVTEAPSPTPPLPPLLKVPTAGF